MMIQAVLDGGTIGDRAALHGALAGALGFPDWYGGNLDALFDCLTDLREDADLTQRQVGEAINVPQRTYAYYESGQRMLPPQVLCALADFYHVSVDYLLGRTEKREVNR